MTTSPDIFLSYNREDQATARLYVDAFAAEGFDVWWDTALRPGEAYDEVTEAALRGAKAVVVLWSPRSVVSRWVRAEATVADRCNTLVPAMIEPCERPIMFELTQTAELSHWQGDTKDQAWLTFLGDVRRFVEQEATATGEAPPAPHAAPTVEETLKPGQLSDTPSLAVLPFTNRSGLPEDEVFAEGMVEDVISALTQGVNVRVLGSTTTANLPRAAISDLPALGRQLGVRYLLEGNVRRIGTDLRVTTQVLEAESGTAIWAARFNRPLAELAELQEELVTDIAGSLDTQFNTIEMEKALAKPGDLTAWQECMLAMSAFRKFNEHAILNAVIHSQRAIEIAPNYGLAHAFLANALANIYLVSADNPTEAERISAIAERAITLAPEDAMVLAIAGFALSFVGQVEEGARHTARAVSKAPGSGLSHYSLGIASIYAGQPEQALMSLETAVRLLPGSPFMVWVKSWQSQAFFQLSRWEEAEAAINECIRLLPSLGSFYAVKARLCQLLGREMEVPGHIRTALQFGWTEELSLLLLRRAGSNSPRLDQDIADTRALFASVKPQA